MARTTITLFDEQEEIIEGKTGEGGEYESISECVRELIQSGERAHTLGERVTNLEEQLKERERELEQARTRVEELEERLEERAERVADLETDVERLENEKRLILEQREEKQELERYVESEMAYRDAGLLQRATWWLRGRERE